MKKFSMTLILSFAILFTSMVFGACGVNEITELVVIGNANVEFYENEVNNSNSNISVRATFKDGKTIEVKADDERVTITGFDTTTAGRKTMKITFTDGKTSGTCDLGYVVYTTEQTIISQTDLDKIKNNTSENDNGKLFFPENFVADMTDRPISRDLELIGRNGKKVVLKNVKINTSEDKDIKVTFNNITFTNSIDGGNALTVVGDEKVDLTINKSTILASGNCNRGVLVNKKGKFEIKDSEFKTPYDNDIFNAMLYFDTSRDENAETLITGNVIICNFSYGFQNIFNATITNNNINATLGVAGIGEYVRDSRAQKSFVAKKNPALLHCNLPERLASQTDKKVFLHVSGNTVQNLQNFLRIYQLDMFDYQTQTDFVFEDNTLNSVAVLVNTSNLSFANLSNILADLKKDIKTGYIDEYKAVIEKDTEISISKDMEYTKIDLTSSYIYYDFNNENQNYATMQIGNKEYIYIGKAGKLTDLLSNSCNIIKDNDKYYIISRIDYSPIGDVAYFMSETGVTKSITEAKVFDEATIKTLLGMGE